MRVKFPAAMKADLPKFWYFSGLTNPEKLLRERFKNLRPSRGGKSEGKVPFILLFETSKYFKDRRTETGFELEEILQPEISRCSSPVRFRNPEGRVPKPLFERSRTLSLAKPESRTRLVNRFEERLRT